MERIKAHLKKIKPFHIVSILAVGGIALAAMNFSHPPLFTSFDNFILFAKEEIKLEQGVQVSSGDLGSNGEIDIEKDNIINGNLFADKIEIDKNTQINGNVSFNKLDIQPGVKILGTKATPITLPVALLPNVPDFSVGAQDLKFQGQSNTLASGNYRDITIEKESRVILSGGTYNLRKLILKENSTLIFNALTTLNIQQKLKGQEHIAIITANNSIKPTDLKINYQGKNEEEGENKKDKDNKDNKDKQDEADQSKGIKPIEFGQNSFLNFKLLAPKASIHIGESSILRGQILARKIKIEKDSVLSRDMDFEKESDPNKIITDAGIKFIANEIVILFKNEATQLDVQQVAASVNGIIIGLIVNPNIVKIKVQTATAQELNNKIQIIKNLNNPRIIEVVQNLVGE